MTFVEDNHHLFMEDGMVLVVFNEDGEFLYGGNNNLIVVVGAVFVPVFELSLKHSGRCIAVCCSFFKSVILCHRLVVEVFSVHHEKHLINAVQLRRQLGRFEGGQGLAAACGVPNIAASLCGPIVFVVVGHVYSLDNTFCRRYLVGPHHQQHLLGGEHTIFCQDIEKGMF